MIISFVIYYLIYILYFIYICQTESLHKIIFMSFLKRLNKKEEETLLDDVDDGYKKVGLLLNNSIIRVSLFHLYVFYLHVLKMRVFVQ